MYDTYAEGKFPDRDLGEAAQLARLVTGSVATGTTVEQTIIHGGDGGYSIQPAVGPRVHVYPGSYPFSTESEG